MNVFLYIHDEFFFREINIYVHEVQKWPWKNTALFNFDMYSSPHYDHAVSVNPRERLPSGQRNDGGFPTAWLPVYNQRLLAVSQHIILDFLWIHSNCKSMWLIYILLKCDHVLEIICDLYVYQMLYTGIVFNTYD